MEVAEIANLLGRPSTDPLVEGQLRRFRIEERPEVGVVDNDADGPVLKTDDWLLSSAAGIEFGFEDEAAFLGHDRFEYGSGPMLLTQLYLYGVHDGVRPYGGPLPLGLRYTDDPASVRGKLAPFESKRRSYLRDAWDLERFTLIASYTEDGSSIDFLLCLLKQPPLPPLDPGAVVLPSIGDVVALFGSGWLDPQLREVFVPLGLDRHAHHLRGGPIASFRTTYGFDLAFHPPSFLERRPDRAVWGLVLSEVVFFRDRMLGARAWPGSLPFALQFDDSPDDVVSKVPAAFDERVDEDFTGWVLWHLPEFSLQVHYSTMENFVLRVRVMAPGVWASLRAA